ncbi:MAG: phosphatase PAP2-related protein, partial [bacterium]|nr:phosphatase PAP2-related protein [bacterium]
MQETDSFTYKDIFCDGELYSLLTAFFMLGFAYVFEHFANIYAFAYSERPTSSYVGDLFLDNLPAVDLNLIIIEGAFLSIILGTLYLLSKPRHILFALKALALFIIVRALFISLTHVGVYPTHIAPGLGFFANIYSYLNFQLGFFFSGHTGLPFLMALVFWDNRTARIVFLSMSLVFGVAVLLAHIHYSIDVLAAPFMAYGIFGIAKRLFPRDYALINRVGDN